MGVDCGASEQQQQRRATAGQTPGQQRMRRDGQRWAERAQWAPWAWLVQAESAAPRIPGLGEGGRLAARALGGGCASSGGAARGRSMCTRCTVQQQRAARPPWPVEACGGRGSQQAWWWARWWAVRRPGFACASAGHAGRPPRSPTFPPLIPGKLLQPPSATRWDWYGSSSTAAGRSSNRSFGMRRRGPCVACLKPHVSTRKPRIATLAAHLSLEHNHSPPARSKPAVPPPACSHLPRQDVCCHDWLSPFVRCPRGLQTCSARPFFFPAA